MALQSSGSISILDIVAEFGGTAPHSLSEYYRGGSLVGDTATNSGVPASGTITIEDFYGAAALTAEFDSTGYSASHGVQDPNDASCTLTVGNNGSINGNPTGTTDGTYENQGELVESDYDIRLVTGSGTVSSGSAVDTWLNLGTTRSWTVNQTTVGTKAFSGTFQIRPAGGGATIDTASVTLTATVSSPL